jgi:hypothetical protein
VGRLLRSLNKSEYFRELKIENLPNWCSEYVLESLRKWKAYGTEKRHSRDSDKRRSKRCSCTITKSPNRSYQPDSSQDFIQTGLRTLSIVSPHPLPDSGHYFIWNVQQLQKILAASGFRSLQDLKLEGFALPERSMNSQDWSDSESDDGEDLVDPRVKKVFDNLTSLKLKNCNIGGEFKELMRACRNLQNLTIEGVLERKRYLDETIEMVEESLRRNDLTLSWYSAYNAIDPTNYHDRLEKLNIRSSSFTLEGSSGSHSDCQIKEMSEGLFEKFSMLHKVELDGQSFTRKSD